MLGAYYVCCDVSWTTPLVWRRAHTDCPLTGMSLSLSLSVLNPCQPRAAQIQWRQLRDTEPNTSSPLAPLLRDGKHRSGSAILSVTSFNSFCHLTESFSLRNKLSARDYLQACPPIRARGRVWMGNGSRRMRRRTGCLGAQGPVSTRCGTICTRPSNNSIPLKEAALPWKLHLQVNLGFV